MNLKTLRVDAAIGPLGLEAELQRRITWHEDTLETYREIATWAYLAGAERLNGSQSGGRYGWPRFARNDCGLGAMQTIAPGSAR